MITSWARPVEMLFGGLMAWGGVMHFTVDQKVWNSPLLNAMADSGFLWREIGIINFVGGIALLSHRFMPLALAMLFPITANIFLHHLTRLDLSGLTIGVPVLALNLVLLWVYRSSYASLFRSST
jgi:hypothetical protein